MIPDIQSCNFRIPVATKNDTNRKTSAYIKNPYGNLFLIFIQTLSFAFFLYMADKAVINLTK